MVCDVRNKSKNQIHKVFSEANAKVGTHRTWKMKPDQTDASMTEAMLAPSICKKECTKCHEQKPLADFGLHPQGRFGRHNRRAKQEQHQQIRATKQYVVISEKKCSRCKETLEIAKFRCETGSRDGKHGVCRDCVKQERQSISDLIRAAKAEQKNTCACCGKVQEPEALEFTHWSREEKHQTKSGKRLGISEMRSIKAIKIELPKGRFLCWKCHILETWQEDHGDDSIAETSSPQRKAVEAEKLVRGKCANCAEALPADRRLWRGFHFDHRDRRRKRRDIAILASLNTPLDALADEMAECDLLCVRCHRKKTKQHREFLSPWTQGDPALDV